MARCKIIYKWVLIYKKLTFIFLRLTTAMPAVAKDGMRGLAVFISDIRNCKSKEAETKRINKVKTKILLTVSTQKKY